MAAESPRPFRSAWSLSCAVLTAGLFGCVGGTHAAPGTPPAISMGIPAAAPQAAAKPPPRRPAGSCDDGEAPGAEATEILAAAEPDAPERIRLHPEAALRCAALLPASAGAALAEAARAAPYDALAADGLSARADAAAILSAALEPGRLESLVGNGTGWLKTRGDSAALVGAARAAALDSAASAALSKALASGGAEAASAASKAADALDESAGEVLAVRRGVLSLLDAKDLVRLLALSGRTMYASSYDVAFDRLLERSGRTKGGISALAADPRLAAGWAGLAAASAEHGRAGALVRAAGGGEIGAEAMARAVLSDEGGLGAAEAAAALVDASFEAGGTSVLKAAERIGGDAPKARAALRLAARLVALEADPRAAAAAPAWRDGRTVERMAFYPDEDGRASRRAFAAGRAARGWEERRMDGFSVFESPPRRGRRIVVVVDDPDGGDAGRAAADRWLAERGLSVEIVVHRGHSYHEAKTLPLLSPLVKVVVWGSCGGYARAAATLERAPWAVVAATRDIGATALNEAVLDALHEELLDEGRAEWGAVWRRAGMGQGGKARRGAGAYIRPDRNSLALAIGLLAEDRAR